MSKQVKIIRVKKIPFDKDALALNLFGVIFAVDEMTPQEINHELIHTAQEKELGYIFFYIWYVVEWLCLCAKYRDRIKAYFNIRFEKEAYRHGDDLTYLQRRKHYRYNQ